MPHFSMPIFNSRPNIYELFTSVYHCRAQHLRRWSVHSYCTSVGEDILLRHLSHLLGVVFTVGGLSVLFCLSN